MVANREETAACAQTTSIKPRDTRRRQTPIDASKVNIAKISTAEAVTASPKTDCVVKAGVAKRVEIAAEAILVTAERPATV